MMTIAGAPQIILDFRHVASSSKPDRPKLATGVEKLRANFGLCKNYGRNGRSV